VWLSQATLRQIGRGEGERGGGGEGGGGRGRVLKKEKKKEKTKTIDSIRSKDYDLCILISFISSSVRPY